MGFSPFYNKYKIPMALAKTYKDYLYNLVPKLICIISGICETKIKSP